MMDGVFCLTPDWPVPSSVRAYITLRSGGVSKAPFDSLNLAGHVGDDIGHVDENRRRLRTALELPSEPLWLTQVHGCDVADATIAAERCEADAAYTNQADKVCAVLTADCLPLLIADKAGGQVAAVHAGWRGLASGVVEAALDKFDTDPADLMVWLGPAIGPDEFEVGADVRDAFIGHDNRAADCFSPNRPGHWLADIYALARLRLASLGIGFVGGGEYCTVSDPTRFYSYRRDGVTGRMASLIWVSR